MDPGFGIVGAAVQCRYGTSSIRGHLRQGHDHSGTAVDGVTPADCGGRSQHDNGHNFPLGGNRRNSPNPDWQKKRDESAREYLEETQRSLRDENAESESFGRIVSLPVRW